MNKYFTFQGRIRRTAFGLRYILYLFLWLILEALYEDNEIAVLLYIPLIWFGLSAGVRRCHDLNKSGWWFIIPFYVLWLLFEPGFKGVNAYGPDPKDTNLSVRNISDLNVTITLPNSVDLRK